MSRRTVRKSGKPLTPTEHQRRWRAKPQVAVMTAYDGIRRDCLDFLSYDADIGLIAAIVTEAIEAEVVVEASEKGDFVTKGTEMAYTREYVKENAAALALVCACLALPQPAAAQQDFLTFRQQMRPTPPKGRSHLHRWSDAQMGVIADRVDYDYTNNQFAVVGSVQIYYNGATIEADRVVYDQTTKRMRAEGARLTEANGKVTVGQVIDLTNYYRDGFVDSLGLETVAPRHAGRQPQRRPLLRQP